MSGQGRFKQWFWLFVIFGVVPGIFFLLVIHRGLKNIDGYKARQLAAERRIQEIANVKPLSSEEKRLLQNPAAAWRSRIPLLADDAARLWHYHRVVTDLQRVWKQNGVVAGKIRSSFDPIQGSFSLPSTLGDFPADISRSAAPHGHLQAWAFEVSVDGASTELFRALDALPEVDPLLEPVGLRWEAGPEGHRQYLVLRNLVLTP